MTMNTNGAGAYNRPLQHLIRSTSKDNFGGTEYTFATDGRVFFGNVEQTDSQEVDELGRIITKTMATIRVRGWYININVLDRFLDLQWQETYIIDSINRGDDEYIITAHHL